MASKINQTILKIANAYLNVLREHNIHFESAWLFGSYSNNQYSEDSDIDIAVIMKDVEKKFFKEVELMKYRRNIDYRIEPHIIIQDELDSPFSQEIMRSGIRIA